MPPKKKSQKQNKYPARNKKISLGLPYELKKRLPPSPKTDNKDEWYKYLLLILPIVFTTIAIPDVKKWLNDKFGDLFGQNEIQRLIQTRVQLQGDLGEAHGRLDRIQTEHSHVLNGLYTTQREREAQIMQLNGDLQKAQQSRIGIENDALSEFRIKDHQIEMLNERQISQLNKIEQYKREIALMKGENDQIQQNIQIQYQQLNSDKVVLRNRIVELEEQQTILRQNGEIYTNKLKGMLEKEQDACSKAMEQLKKQESHIIKLNTDIATHQSHLDTNIYDHNVTKQQYTKLQSEHTKVIDSLQKLNIDMSTIKLELQNKIQAIETKDNVIRTIKGEFQTLTDTYNSTNKEFMTQSLQLIATERNVVELTKRITQIEQHYEQQQAELQNSLTLEHQQILQQQNTEFELVKNKYEQLYYKHKAFEQHATSVVEQEREKSTKQYIQITDLSRQIKQHEELETLKLEQVEQYLQQIQSDIAAKIAFYENEIKALKQTIQSHEGEMLQLATTNQNMQVSIKKKYEKTIQHLFKDTQDYMQREHELRMLDMETNALQKQAFAMYKTSRSIWQASYLLLDHLGQDGIQGLNIPDLAYGFLSVIAEGALYSDLDQITKEAKYYLERIYQLSQKYPKLKEYQLEYPNFISIQESNEKGLTIRPSDQITTEDDSYLIDRYIHRLEDAQGDLQNLPEHYFRKRYERIQVIPENNLHNVQLQITELPGLNLISKQSEYLKNLQNNNNNNQIQWDK